jgi:hypothetical protein
MPQKREGGLIGSVIKGGTFLVGIGTEVHAHRKAAKTNYQKSQYSTTQSRAINDERSVSANASPPSYDEAIVATQPTAVISPQPDEKVPSIERPMTISALPRPVILPQRRPNDKSRGFVRAYAPDLGTYKGIDEATFLDFLKQFHTSSQASGWLKVINVAAIGAGFAPSLIAIAVSASVQAGARIGLEAQTRYRTNTYLDKANEELFHPRNLHCMVMTFKPDNADTLLSMNAVDGTSSPRILSRLSSYASSSMSPGAGSNSGKYRKVGSDGVTNGELEFPEAAALVYPSPSSSQESLYDDDANAQRPSTWKTTGKVLSDYKDRRAQAKWSAEHGHDSQLSMPGATDSNRFASKWSDPNANPLGFITDLRQQRSRGKAQLRPDELLDRVRSRGQSGGSSGPGGLIGGVKNFMKQDVLYLLIAEIPSDEEMRRMAMV